MTYLNDLKQLSLREMCLDPADDCNFTFVPARYGRLVGDLVTVKTRYGNYRLPDGDRYVLYSLNRTNPEEIGLRNKKDDLFKWVRLDTLFTDTSTIIQVYMNQRMVPLHTCYMMITNRHEMLLCVSGSVNRKALLEGEELRIRFFTNDWLSTNSTGNVYDVEAMSADIAEVSDVIPVLNKWSSATTSKSILYHNGYLSDSFMPAHVEAGDSVMVNIDHTIVGIVEFTLSELHHYNPKDSTRSGQLLLPLNLAGKTRIVPSDEVDIYIVGEGTYRGFPGVRGVFYDRDKRHDVLQITHQDLSINANRVYTILNAHKDVLGIDDPKIRVYIRRTNSLPQVAPRTPGNYAIDLYRCSQSDRDDLMLGPGNHYIPWQPDNLEVSGWATIAHAKPADSDTPGFYKGIYTYEEMCRRVAQGVSPDTILTFSSGFNDPYYRYPFMVQCGGFILGYNVDGVLIETIRVPAGTSGTGTNMMDGVRSARFIPGSGTVDGSGWDRPMGYMDQSDYFGERFYWRTEVTDAWQVAVKDTDFSIDENTGEFQWGENHLHHYFMRRSIRDSFFKEVDIEPELLWHPIELFSTEPVSDLPLSHVEIYMNGNLLVKGVDYQLRDNAVEINSKQYYLDQLGGTVNVKIFMYGLPDQPDRVYDTGWVRNRRMLGSQDTLTITHGMTGWVDGKITPLSKFDLIENATEADGSLREGGLFVKTSVVPSISPWVASVFGCDDTALKAISNLVIPKLKVPYDNTRHVFPPYFHALYSPALYQIVQDIRDKVIDVGRGDVTRGSVAAALFDYQPLIERDISRLPLDWDFIDLHPFPHNEQITVSPKEVSFLSMASELYFNNRASFSAYLNVNV